MKLIVEKINGSVYVYQETEKHHKRVEKERSNSQQKVPFKHLDKECNMDKFPDNSYVAIDIKQRLK